MMIIRFLLVAVMLVLVGCGQSAAQVGEATRPSAEVLETVVSRTQTPRTTVIVPTLVPTRTSPPTTAPTEEVRPTDIPPTASATVEPPTPTDIATVTPLPTLAPTETVAPTETAAPSATAEPTSTTVEPSATPIEESPTAAGEPNIDPLPGDYMVIPWEGLIIPIPDGYDDRMSDDEESLNGVPIEAKLEVAPSDEDDDDDDSDERINPMVYTIVRFSKGSEGWLDAVRSGDEGQRTIDAGTIKSATVAGYPGQSYEPQGSGNDQRLNYVIELGEDRLLLITIDQAHPEQSRAIPFIERDVPSAATPVTTATVSAGGQLSGEIAYVLDRDIWLHDLRSAESRQLTELGNVQAFAWSPDGRRIAFAAGNDDTDIWTVDVRNGKPKEVTEGTDVDMLPAYGPKGELFFLRRSITDEATTIDIVQHKGSKDTVVHSEPGGLVGPTTLRFRNEHEWALAVSTGRGRYVLLGDLRADSSKDLAETYLSAVAGCAYDIAWREREAVILSSIDCIPHENSTISQLDLLDQDATPTTIHTGAGISSVDWAADGALVWSRNETGSESNGIWVMAPNNEPQRILEEGVQPMWRP